MGKETLLRTAEVASRLNVHPDTIRRWIKAGHFPNAYKAGPSSKSPYVIPEQDIVAFEDKLQQANHNPDD